jgi:hypothetical protein
MNRRQWAALFWVIGAVVLGVLLWLAFFKWYWPIEQ